MVGVHPDHRRRGIARRLVLECIELARAQGKRRLTLETQPTMSAARALYDSLGFRPIAPYRYNPVEGTLFLEKDL